MCLRDWSRRSRVDAQALLSHYYHTVIHAANVTGFRMSHVRVRAWAFLGGGIGSMAGLQPNDIASSSWLSKRVFNYSYGSQRGDLLMVENCTDFAITDNDLVATWTGVEIHNSDHGVVARNDIWPGTHGCHGMINIYAVTFEHNRCVGAVQGSRLYLKYACASLHRC